ncbi:MAG: hypothetical protein H6831_14010 [Planctomycetes bacterium]|nr:hypothetical protein [Planctomycetota bacterium]MCB9905515.1 hypothetical protein [Planctomycetota bacterium]
MFERFYQPDSPFVYVRLSGVLDDFQVRQQLDEYNQEARGRTGILELADARYVEDVDKVSVKGLVDSAGLERGQSRVEGGKLAVVVRTPVQYGLARAYTEISSNFRDAVAVFYDFDEALRWLLPPDRIDDARDFIASRPPPAGPAS